MMEFAFIMDGATIISLKLSLSEIDPLLKSKMNMNNIKLNVRGSHFEAFPQLVTNQVLLASTLGQMVYGSLSEDPNKAVCIDRSAELFALVLEYLHFGRYGDLSYFCYGSHLNFLLHEK